MSEDTQAPRKRRWPRALGIAAAALGVAIVAVLGGGYVFLGSQAALDYVMRRAVEAGEGHLVIEGAEGSLLSTVRIARIAWQGSEIDVEARDTAVAWSPMALLSRKVSVTGLGARRLVIDFKKAQSNSQGGMPDSLALPLEVDVRNIGVERLEWKTAAQQGSITGIVFDYAGGATRHEVRNLRLVAPQGTLAGNARIAATPPYSLSADLAFIGDGAWKTAAANLAVTGTAQRMKVEAKGAYHEADVAIRASVAPFETALVESADIEARKVDLAKFAETLPATDVRLTLAARPQGAGFAGTLRADNEAVGPVDRGRVPVASLASAFAWDGTTVSLTDIDATLAGNARVRGNVSLAPRGGPVRIDLALAGVDLAQLQSSLVATRLTGTLAGEVERERQVLRGDLRQADLALAFDAIVEGGRAEVRSARAQAGKGTLTGSGSFAFGAARAFALKARASRFDPSRFAAIPEAQLDGTIDVRGTLAPFTLEGSVAIDKGSRFAGLDAAGSARGAIAKGTARDLAVDVTLGSSTLKLAGSFGSVNDKLAYDADLRKLAELRPLVSRYAKDALPEAIAGALRARGTVSGTVSDNRASPAVSVDAHGTALQWGSVARAGTLDVKATLGGGQGLAGPIALDASAADLTVSGKSVKTASVSARGTLAEHRATIAAATADIDLTATVAGGLVEAATTGTRAWSGWNGTVQTLANRGLYAFALRAPARVQIARERYLVEDVHIGTSEGHVDVASLLVEQGRITTSGSFTGVSMSAAAKLAGTPLPFASSLRLGGDWSIVASPRLSGTFNVRRESGDWYGTESSTLDPSALALGITTLEVAGRFSDDALAATATFRSSRAGTLDAKLALAAGSVPGVIDTRSPMTASVNAELASLRPLQPWIGTLAVMDGRAVLALTGRGSLADPILDGTLRGDALRFDLPQYGVHLKDGTLRVRLADRAITLDELSFAGGAGRFTAKGTLARADAQRAVAGGKVEWEASDFTVVNRPDLRIVADGKGTLALVDRKVVLAGSIAIEEGRVEYEPSRPGTLGDDVVIVGQDRKPQDGGRPDLPLVLDLQVSLGRDFRFSGEGLDTRLAGRVHLVTTPAGTINAQGTIRAVAGTYYVFGQRLDIDRGRLIFDGPVDNPALDVVALRKNLAVEAGVELTGTVRVPRVRLVSTPPVPDGEKLSWLLTGQGLDRASRNDLAMLGAASASLISRGQRPITTQIANTIGLDDISVRDSGNAVAGGPSSQVVAFGKRLTDRLSLVYEQGLTAANNALRIEYALTRTLTLRAEAGVVSSVGLYFRRTFD